MTYRFIRGAGRWKIEALEFDRLRRWQLHFAAKEAWLGLQVFASAEDAMVAVGQGTTGIATWDAGLHAPSDFTSDQWSCEGW